MTTQPSLFNLSDHGPVSFLGPFYEPELTPREVAGRMRLLLAERVRAGELPAAEYLVTARIGPPVDAIDIRVRMNPAGIVNEVRIREILESRESSAPALTEQAESLLRSLRELHRAFVHEVWDRASGAWTRSYAGDVEFEAQTWASAWEAATAEARREPPRPQATKRRSAGDGAAVHIPVVFRDGVPEFLYGGPLPAIFDGTIGELRIAGHGLADAEVRASLTQRAVELMFPKGEKLFVRLNPNQVDRAELSRVQEARHLRRVGHEEFLIVVVAESSPSSDGPRRSKTPVEELGGLGLRFRGTRQAELMDCPIDIPGLAISADSLNHAYKLISERLEPRRRAHTGNVFELVKYEDQEGRLHPLERRRAELIEKFEQRFAIWESLAPALSR